MNNYTYHRERFDQTYVEMSPLYRRHFDEVRDHKRENGLDQPDYALDVKGYFAYAASDQLVSYVVRCDGRAVGYLHVYLLYDHRSGELVAIDDSLFVLPDHRTGVGRSLIEYAIAELSKTKAQKFTITASGDPRVATLLGRMGFKQTAIEMTYDLEGGRHVRK